MNSRRVAVVLGILILLPSSSSATITGETPLMDKITVDTGQKLDFSDIDDNYTVKSVDEKSVTFSTTFQVRDFTMSEYASRTIEHDPEITMYTCETGQDSVDLIFRKVWPGGDRGVGNPKWVCNLDSDDSDRDGRPNTRDTCPYVAKGDHTDYDNDGLGYTCDGYVLSCDAPHAKPSVTGFDLEGSLQPGTEVKIDGNSVAAFVYTDITNREWYVDGTPFKSGISKGSIKTTFEEPGTHSVTLKVTAECNDRTYYDSKTKEFQIERLDYKKAGGMDHWDGDLSTANNFRSLPMDPNHKYKSIDVEADIYYRVEGVRFQHSFSNGQMSIYRIGYKLKNGTVNWIKDGEWYDVHGFSTEDWNYIRFPETDQPINKWIFGVYNGHDDKQGRFSIQEIQPAVTEKISRPEKSLEILRRGPERDLPYSYAINHPRVVSNQYVDFALEGWHVSAGLAVKNRLMDETLQLEPVMKINGEPVNDKKFMRTYSSNVDFTNGMKLEPGEIKTIALYSDGDKIAKALGDGRKKFTLEINGRTVDLGAVTVTDADYMVRSMEGSLARGEKSSVSFTGKGKASIAGGDIPRPTVVVGTADRERILTTVGIERSSGSRFYTKKTNVDVPSKPGSDLVAVAINSEKNVKELFRSGKGYEKVILKTQDSSNTGDNEKKKDEKDQKENIDISPPKNPQKGGSSRAVVSVPDSVEEKYRVAVKNPEGKRILNKKFAQNRASIKIKTGDAGEYTIQVFPSGTLSSVISIITGPLAEKSFSVQEPEVARWKQLCRDKGYNTEKIQAQIKCIKQEIVPTYFQNSVGENPEVAESLCSDLLNYRYSQKEKKCLPPA